MYTDFDDCLRTSLVLVKQKNNSVPYILATCNKQIAECLGIPYNQRLLDSFDENIKKTQAQYYNVLTNKLESITPDNILQVLYLGIPVTFIPGWLHSKHVSKKFKESSFEVYYNSMQPLFNKIKEFKSFNINDFGKNEPNQAVLNLNQKLKNLNINIPENNIVGFVHFIAYSDMLSEAFLKNYQTLDFLPSVQSIFKALKFELKATTYNEFCDKLKDITFLNELKSVYISYLNNIKNEQIIKLKEDLKNLDNALTDDQPFNSLVNVTDVKTQLYKQINLLEDSNFEKELENITSPYIIYKFWPFNIVPPDEIFINEPFFTKKDINLFKILLKEFSEEKAINIITAPGGYFNEVLLLREKQIIEHRNNLVREIDNDISNTNDDDEKNDLLQIKKLLMDDNELYKIEISTKSTVTEILEYWPVMLYPIPSFVLSYND